MVLVAPKQSLLWPVPQVSIKNLGRWCRLPFVHHPDILWKTDKILDS